MCGRHRRQFRNGRLDMLLERRTYSDGKTSLPVGGEAESLGAGEILFTSMTHDGVKDGYANEALAMLADNLHIPVIASGGAGKMEHFRDTFAQGKADAALAASVFHFGEIGIGALKQYLHEEGINVRL